MSVLRREHGTALITTILLVAVMFVMGAALLAIVDAQSGQARQERVGESAFDVAEATLNAEAFLLGRNWPRSGTAAPCSGQFSSGTLADPAPSVSPTHSAQIQSILAQSHEGDGPAGAQWWVTACEENNRSAWDSSLLDGRAYDPTITSAPGARPRRMWVRAEARVSGHRRAVVALVQAGQQAVFPNGLAVVAGRMGADVTSTVGQLTAGGLVGPIVGGLVGGSGKTIEGSIGLRCSLLDISLTSSDGLINCLSGIYKLTSMLTLSPLLQANDFYDFPADSTISADQLAQLRQEARLSDTYYPTPGSGSVAAGAPCLPSGSAGKVIFIEQVGDGTGSCVLNTVGGVTAKALVVGSGGVRVTGGGRYTGVIYALHRKAPLAGNAADVSIEGGSKVFGGVYVDGKGLVNVVPPPVTGLTDSPLCHLLPILGGFVCGTLNALLSTVPLGDLLGQILPQLNVSLPAITYDKPTVDAVSTFGDSAIVTGTFRQVAPMY